MGQPEGGRIGSKDCQGSHERIVPEGEAGQGSEVRGDRGKKAHPEDEEDCRRRVTWRVKRGESTCTIKMILDGKQVALTTGTDIETAKEKLFRGYFHLPYKRPRS